MGADTQHQLTMGSPAPDPATAWNVVLTLLVLCNLAATGIALARATKSQKREVTLTSDYITDASCTLHRNTSDNRITRVEADIAALRLDLKQAVDSWREEGDERARRLHARIDDLPAQIIALLKNTGAIK